MVSLSDDHYEIDISRARDKLDWSPRHTRERLPIMVEALKREPEEWYRRNKLSPPIWLMADELDDSKIEDLREQHTELVRRDHRQNLWAHFLTIALGAWLLTSRPTLGYESAILAASDMVCGVLIMAFAALSLSWRMPWARMANGVIGVYLLFAPLLFWAPTAAAYLNDTITGALVIGLATVVRPPVGVSVIARMTGPDVPPGWEYSPSTWTQRLPVIGLAFVGLYISRYLTAYQLGHIEQVWDPRFGGGTARIIRRTCSLDELIATCQFLAQRRRKGQPLWQVLLHGDTAAGGRTTAPTDFEQPVKDIIREMWGGGLNLPWTLTASIAIVSG
jgi:hypothetical protein